MFLKGEIDEPSGGLELFLIHHRSGILALGADVAVDELDHRDRGSIRRTDARLDDARVAAVAVSVSRSYDVEQLGELSIVHQPRLGEAAVRKATVLGERDQLLDIGTKLFRLRGRGQDLLVLYERCSHVAEQGRTVAGGALKLTAANTMAHRSFLSFVRGPYQVTP